MDDPSLEQVVSLALQLSLVEQAQLIEQVAAWMAQELNQAHTVDPIIGGLGDEGAVPHDSFDSNG